jgi:hypothetical protein
MLPAQLIHVIRSVPSRDAGKPSVRDPPAPAPTSCVAWTQSLQIQHPIDRELASQLQAKVESKSIKELQRVHPLPTAGTGSGSVRRYSSSRVVVVVVVVVILCTVRSRCCLSPPSFASWLPLLVLRRRYGVDGRSSQIARRL